MRDKYGFIPNDAASPSHHAKRDELATLFGADKTTRKGNSDTAAAQLGNSLSLAIDYDGRHRALHTYERAHLQGGGNWPQLKASLLLQFPAILRIVDNLPASSDFMMTVAAREERVGTVYFDESRFEALNPQPPLVANPVYKRRNDGNVPPRHYIQLTTSATHVKRFVTRGLSAFDAMNITANQPLISVLSNPTAQATEIGGFKHAKLAGVVLNDNEQILTHTRGWGGNKRFISTGVSIRPALSTRGVPFLSMYGVVTVDLAMVATGHIFDVHRHDTAQARLGVQANDILNNPHHTGTADLAEEQYLGLRDTIRTRELLIKGGIPLNALRQVSAGCVLLGIGSGTNPLNKAMQKAAVAVVVGLVQEDLQTFVDPASGLRWYFMEFPTPQAVTAAQLLLTPLLAGRRMVAFDKYAQLRPTGMV